MMSKSDKEDNNNDNNNDNDDISKNNVVVVVAGDEDEDEDEDEDPIVTTDDSIIDDNNNNNNNNSNNINDNRVTNQRQQQQHNDENNTITDSNNDNDNENHRQTQSQSQRQSKRQQTQPQTQQQPKRQYRIAMVCDFFYPRLGGVEMHIWSLSQHLLQMGHKVIVITHAYDNRKGVRYMAGGPLKVYYCPIIPMTDQDALPTITATFPLLRSILIREQIEIVHAHQATSVMANESVVYAAAMGLSSVYTDHSLFQFDDLAGVILNRVLQTTLSTANAAICVSHACRENLLLRAHLHPQRVHVIPNAVDTCKFTPNNYSTTTHNDDNNQNSKNTENERIKVVVISRLVYRKGVDLLVGTIPKICHAIPYVDFIIGGDGNKLLDLQEMVERETLEHRVEFLNGGGPVPHSEVANVLRRGQVFLNCSLTESFCIAILEAASCGLLVVSTNVGGVPEVLPSPEMAILCNPNVDDLVNGLQQAIQRQRNPQTAIDPFYAHEQITKMYSWKRVAEETVSKVYDKIIQEPPKSFMERLYCYNSNLGGYFSGLVACILAAYIELWIRFVEWIQPKESIDIVPDLIPNYYNTTTTTKEKIS